MKAKKEQAGPVGIVLVLVAGVVFVWWHLRRSTPEPKEDPENDPKRPMHYRECLRTERLINEEQARLKRLIAQSPPKTLKSAVSLIGRPTDACTTRPLRGGGGQWITSWSPRSHLSLTDTRLLAARGEAGVGYLVRVWTKGSCAEDAVVEDLFIGSGSSDPARWLATHTFTSSDGPTLPAAVPSLRVPLHCPRILRAREAPRQAAAG